MLLTDEELNRTLRELAKVLNPKYLELLKSHVGSLADQVRDLRASRDNLRRKYEEAKANKEM